MITDGFTYLALLIAVAGALKYVEEHSRLPILNKIPAIVSLYFVVMLLSTLGVWEKSASIDAIYSGFKSNLLMAMIFLMLLQSNLKQIAGLGPRLLLGYAAASISIMLGFVVSFLIFHTWLASDAWMTFATLSGSWIGGTGNMLAVQGALSIPDASMGYTLLVDSIDYAIWVVLLLALVNRAPAFNSWVKADTRTLASIGARLDVSDAKPTDFASMLFLLGAALVIAAITQHIAALLPALKFLSQSTWGVIIITLLGIIGGQTPLGKLKGADDLANLMLYTMIALIASRADFADLGQAPLYVAAGFVILLVHAIIMIIVAKIFRLDLFTLGIASLANIGGVASAPILAAAYSKALIPVGVLMALLGYIIGTGCALLLASLLRWIA